MIDLRPILAVIVIFLILGCIPIPTPEHYAYELPRRQNVDEEILMSIEINTTTKEDILLKIGEPDYADKERNIFLYRWEMIVGYLVDGCSGTSSPIYERNLLLIQFDENELVQRYTKKEAVLSFKSPIEEVSNW